MAKYADFMAEMRQTKVHMVKHIIRTLLLAMLVGLAPSGCLWGQAGSSPDKPAQAAPTNTNEETNKNAEAATAPAKPHDDTFIIGVDDVLAVNVWKETEVSRSVPGISLLANCRSSATMPSCSDAPGVAPSSPMSK